MASVKLADFISLCSSGWFSAQANIPQALGRYQVGDLFGCLNQANKL